MLLLLLLLLGFDGVNKCLYNSPCWEWFCKHDLVYHCLDKNTSIEILPEEMNINNANSSTLSTRKLQDKSNAEIRDIEDAATNGRIFTIPLIKDQSQKREKIINFETKVLIENEGKLMYGNKKLIFSNKSHNKPKEPFRNPFALPNSSDQSSLENIRLARPSAENIEVETNVESLSQALDSESVSINFFSEENINITTSSEHLGHDIQNDKIQEKEKDLKMIFFEKEEVESGEPNFSVFQSNILYILFFTGTLLYLLGDLYISSLRNGEYFPTLLVSLLAVNLILWIDFNLDIQRSRDISSSDSCRVRWLDDLFQDTTNALFCFILLPFILLRYLHYSFQYFLHPTVMADKTYRLVVSNQNNQLENIYLYYCVPGLSWKNVFLHKML